MVVLALVTVGAPIGVFVSQGSQVQAEAEARANRPVQRHTVARGLVEVTVNAIGRTEANTVNRLTFTSAGRIVELPAQVGMRVREGDLLARQNSQNAELALESAQLALDLAVLRRDQLLAGPDETQVRIAEANIDAARGAVVAAASAVTPADVQAAQLQVQAAEQALADAQQARNTAAGGQSDQTYALLDARVGQASFNAEIARLQLAQVQRGSPSAVGAAQARVEQAEAELARLLAPPSDAELERAEAAIAQAQLGVDSAQAALDRLSLRAPFDGVVTAVTIEIGALAAPGLPAVEVTDLTPLRLTVQVDEIDVRQIREGMPARVTLDALPDREIAAELERIAVVATNINGIVNYDVDVRMSDEDPRARPGMTAEAVFAVETRSDVLVVPNEYIRIDRLTGDAFVNRVLEDGTLREIPVTLGLQGQGVSEVTAGLREGDVIGVDLAGDAIGLFGG
jgi:HlyD family secretion protein